MLEGVACFKNWAISLLWFCGGGMCFLGGDFFGCLHVLNCAQL